MNFICSIGHDFSVRNRQISFCKDYKDIHSAKSIISNQCSLEYLKSPKILVVALSDKTIADFLSKTNILNRFNSYLF